ncbi:hypothetical protein GCM10011351_23930 [Paraliobacillus quinghaiensis]|uniref:DUF3993 domain-containing protein n=1 Tax=Paraliobacillus quinghaiensis TaxID=470815 RepID=A0A917WWS6_9BACI|nr:hypothetical protein [Paraliobacillus quinghaiensis]GGM36964.1 hypothetical protein GCM10011351_23930 [Paraliobacillus quinghaiensis]
MKRKKLKIILSFVAIIPLLLFSYQGQTNGNGTTEQHATNELDGKNISNEEKVNKVNVIQANAENTNKVSLTHSELIDITNEFMDILVQDVDQDYKVKAIDTKAELINKFKKITTAEVAEEYVSFYYREKADGLYIIPTETPPWFVETEPYHKDIIAENKVKITQENKSDLYGDYTIEIELTYDESWKITNIYHHNTNNDTIETNQVV